MCTESGGDAVGYVGGVESAVFFVSRVGRGSGGGGGDGAIASVSGEREEEREDEEERGGAMGVCHGWVFVFSFPVG